MKSIRVVSSIPTKKTFLIFPSFFFLLYLDLSFWEDVIRADKFAKPHQNQGQRNSIWIHPTDKNLPWQDKEPYSKTYAKHTCHHRKHRDSYCFIYISRTEESVLTFVIFRTYSSSEKNSKIYSLNIRRKLLICGSSCKKVQHIFYSQNLP